MSRRTWDDERKRRQPDEHQQQQRSRWDEEGPSRHREPEAKRHRRFEEDPDDEEERYRRREASPPEDRHQQYQHQRRSSNDRQQRRPSNDRQQRRPSVDRYRDLDDRIQKTRSRYEQQFVKKESSPDRWVKSKPKEETKPKPEKEKQDSETVKLSENHTTVNGIPIKYSEPPDAYKPKRKWRLYPFKGEKALPMIHVDKQSCYLLGRERKIADIPLDHLSCSKQHATLQFRLVTFKKDDGTEGKRVRPFLIDLESAHGTFINKVRIEPKRYFELSEKDVIKFGASTREYVVVHEQSKDEHEDDDVAVT